MFTQVKMYTLHYKFYVKHTYDILCALYVLNSAFIVYRSSNVKKAKVDNVIVRAERRMNYFLQPSTRITGK